MALPPRPSYRPSPLHPRRVRGGVRLTKSEAEAGSFPESWAAQRWLRLMHGAAAPRAASEGLQYAAGGQTRSISIDPGRVRALVQGRQMRAYDTAFSVKTMSDAKWQSVVAAMVEQAVYAAKLLAGELPATVEDLFIPLGLRLFPEPGDGDVTASCTCLDFRTQPAHWCKHAACAAYLVADRLATDPFHIFTLRGLPREDLLERLRQHRVSASAPAGGALVYSPHIPGVSDSPARPLEDSVGGFWDMPGDLALPDMPVEPPAVSHPLLRRLGPSPFPSGKFPMIGLLATCYDVISERAVRQEIGDEPTENGEPPAPPATMD